VTEQQMWLALAKASNRRARGHIAAARRAGHEYSVAMACARDAVLTPLEAAHAANALDEVRDR
jgi:hypothetical protein